MTEIETLQHRLAGIIPRARLQWTHPLGCPSLELLLLSDEYPQGELDLILVADVLYDRANLPC